jgi:hypothetical protein
MKGAIADEPPTSNNMPIMANNIITGVSHHFLRCFRNRKKSLIDSIVCKNTIYYCFAGACRNCFLRISATNL